MRTTNSLAYSLLLFCVCSFTFAAGNQPPEGFIALFNGKDLSGWIGNIGNGKPQTIMAMSPAERKKAQQAANEKLKPHWKVEDGMIVNDGKGPYLCTAKDYGDFELYVDWNMAPESDSGIYLRGTPQVQIWNPKKWKGVGSGGLFNNKKNPSKPLVTADNEPGEWNTFRIIMIGERVTVYLNDKLVVDDTPLENYWDRSRSIFPTGQIQLQTHGGEIKFKNIYLREIPRDAPEAGSLDINNKPVGDGWEPLFKGDSLDGWEYEKEYWTLKDGVLRGEYEGGKEHHYMHSKEEYDDFELHAMVKLTGGPKANSGVCIRTKPTNFDNVPGYQVDMGKGYWGCLWDERGDGMVSNYPASDASKIVKEGDWNHYYIVAKGHHIQAWLNGVKTIDIEHPRGEKAGSIAFQLVHGKKHTIAEFKDLYVRKPPMELKPLPADGPGFVSVFNGKDLTGWTGAVDSHTVENGILVSPKKGGGNLYIDKEYSNFIFRFDFKIQSNANNGVGIRAVKGANAAYNGMELQILDNTGPSYRKLKDWQYHGSIYGVAPAKRGYQAPLGTWNHQEIIADGNHIKVTLNGHVILDADISKVGKPTTIDGKKHPGLFNPSGYIGFLGHGHRIEFKNLRIKELK